MQPLICTAACHHMHMQTADQSLMYTDVAEGSEVSSSDSEADEPENDSQSGSADQQGNLPPAPVVYPS